MPAGRPPKLATPIAYPIREWLGKYLSWRRKMYGWKSSSYQGKQLEKFFEHFPPEMGLEYFAIADLQEYQHWRLGKGVNPGTLKMELQAVKAMWRWLIEDMDLPLFNPVRDEPRPRRKSRLTLESFKRLLEFIDYPDVRKYIIGLALGEDRQSPVSHQIIGSLVCAASLKAGLPQMGFVELARQLRSNLWRQAIRSEFADKRPSVSELAVVEVLDELV